MKNLKIIINADDFGGSKMKNLAISYCFQKNLINSTTIMVNTEFFQDALVLANKYDFKSKIGIHLNLTHGKPLTNLAGTGFTDENGFFIRNAVKKPNSFYSTYIKNKIKNEIYEQYKRLLSNQIIPTHIDSHHHIHTLPWLQDIIIEFAVKEKQKVRLATEWSKKNFIRLLKSKRINKKYKTYNINFSDRFERLSVNPDHFKRGKNKDTIYEIMVHPSFENDLLVDCVDNIDLENTIRKLQHMLTPINV